MSKILDDVETELIIDTIAGSDGDLHLAAERLATKLGINSFEIKGYDLEERVSRLDLQSADNLTGRLRTLLAIKLYNLINQATNQLGFAMNDLRPADLAKVHAQLTNSFNSLTQGATKVSFDFSKEIEDAAREFDMPVSAIREAHKELQAKLNQKSRA